MHVCRQQVRTAVRSFATTLSAGATERQFAHLSWLAGCWKGPVGEPGTVEQWTPLAGGTMLGLSRTVGGTTVMYEFMRIVYRFEAPATLRAHIEGLVDGKTQRIDYHFVRGSCESN
jgi:hypothetical protein